MTQFDTSALAEAQLTPAPEPSKAKSPEMTVAPFASVKPTNAAPLARYTHRTALGPLVVPGTWFPRITVAAGPLTLWIKSGLSTTTRFVNAPPENTRPPV